MSKKTKVLAAMSASALVLAGCYAVPVGPHGEMALVAPPPAYPVQGTHAPAFAWPALLNARLYPANEAAAETGIVTGMVTNMQTGKGRFQLNYRGETLVGEATRVSNHDRRGIASAYGTGGSYMNCAYQMNTPYQGSGNCTFSNGAKYQLHVGS